MGAIARVYKRRPGGDVAEPTRGRNSGSGLSAQKCQTTELVVWHCVTPIGTAGFEPATP